MIPQSPFASPFPVPFPKMYPALHNEPPAHMPMHPPEANFRRALNYYADYSGCGHWRMIWPEQVINAHNKMTVHGTTVMSFDPRYFVGVKCVRIQRQATEHQLAFVKGLRKLADAQGFRIVYEIDDVIFSEDIPDYNKYKPAFTDPKIRQCSLEIMSLCDEVTVTCEFMRQYYMSKTGHKCITVIPNYPPEFWMGNHYRANKIEDNYRKFCCGKNAKPRILYPGSGAHFDVENRTNQNDDFAHVRDAIVKTMDKYQWVFFGGYPLPLHQFVQSGKIEFHPWKRLYEYPKHIASLNANIMVAPLCDNNFNKAKSDLKLIEAGCFGIPIACQDIETYSESPVKFKTGDEMIDQIGLMIKNPGYYKTLSKGGREMAEKRFLERDENIDKYVEMYTLPYKDEKRVLLNSINK